MNNQILNTINEIGQAILGTWTTETSNMGDSSPELSFTLKAPNMDDDDEEELSFVLTDPQTVYPATAHNEHQTSTAGSTGERTPTAPYSPVATILRLPQQTTPIAPFTLPRAVLNNRSSAMLAIFKPHEDDDDVFKITTFDIFTESVNYTEGPGNHKDVPKLLLQLSEAGLAAVKELMDFLATMETKEHNNNNNKDSGGSGKKMFYYWVIRSLNVHVDGDSFSVGLCRYVHTPAAHV